MSYGASRVTFGYTPTPWVVRLLVANTAIFLVTWAVGPQFFWEWFGFQPSRLLTRPWGVVTYMFLHGDVWHLLLNMLVLFFFGPPIESRLGSEGFIRYYFICGMGGVALSFFFAGGAPIIGASAAIYGLMLAFAWYWPNAPIYVWGIFPVKAKWLVGFFFLLTFVSAFGGPGGGIAHFAHLGGLLTGFVYLHFGDGIRARLSGLRSAGGLEHFAIVPDREGRDEERQKRPPRPPRSARQTRGEEAVLDEVDRILDKISDQGIASLTDEERKVLDEVSRARRTN